MIQNAKNFAPNVPAAFTGAACAAPACAASIKVFTGPNMREQKRRGHQLTGPA
jgi:hypothetical protein